MAIGAYIAQVTGTAPNFSVVQFAPGPITNAPAGQTGWVSVDLTYPALDNSTQIMTTPVWTVATDGSLVNLTFNVETLDPVWAKMTLINFATQHSQTKAYGGITLNGMQLATTDDKIGALYDVIVALQNGWATAPFTVQTASGAFVALDLPTLTAVAAAIAQFRQSNYAKRQACIAAIQAGTITNEASVLAAI